MLEIERGFVGLGHPPGATIRIQGNAHRRDAGVEAQSHAHGQLRDTGDAKRADARVLLLESLEKLLLVHFHRNIRSDAGLLKENAS